jgi:hypothetical protein
LWVLLVVYVFVPQKAEHRAAARVERAMHYLEGWWDALWVLPPCFARRVGNGADLGFGCREGDRGNWEGARVVVSGGEEPEGAISST